MARKFWTLLPNFYFTQKQHTRGGRQEILFTTLGCLTYYYLYTNFHRKVEPTAEHKLIINDKVWF